MIGRLAYPLLLLSAVMFGGCAATPPDASKSGVAGIADLSLAIQALGSEVDPEEAARAARIAYGYTRQLAIEYEITDPPLVHNAKVNSGLRPRGLCWHWAEDMEARLKAENFRTLDIHRAIANADNPLRIDHSTALISRRGDTMYQAIVLDPWRYGGVLFWSPTAGDTRYGWRPRLEVLEQKRRRQEREDRRFAAVP